jgi:hypothetical protein
MVRDPGNGKYRRTRLFVMKLGCSRKSVRLMRAGQARRLGRASRARFPKLGGAVRVVVLDMFREGVLTPDVYDATLNPVYRDVLTSLWRRRLAVPGEGSRSQRQGRIGGRPRP